MLSCAGDVVVLVISLCWCFRCASDFVCAGDSVALVDFVKAL